jgi:hypothetical protein
MAEVRVASYQNCPDGPMYVAGETRVSSVGRPAYGWKPMEAYRSKWKKVEEIEVLAGVTFFLSLPFLPLSSFLSHR